MLKQIFIWNPKAWRGRKESQFYSLPFGQAVASNELAHKSF